MMQDSRFESILAIDVGAVLTKTTLVARVEGTYRLIGHAQAPSTVELPHTDVIAGVDHALQQLMAATRRKLIDGRGNLITPEQADGAGVDVCVITVSAAGPLRVVLLGLSADLSVSSLQRAAMCTYTDVADVIMRTGGGDGQPFRHLTEEDRVRRIFRARPDVVCIVGGTDGGADTPVIELVESAALAVSLIDESHRPRILFAGNAALRPKVAESIGAEAELKVADNVRPNVDVESIGPAQTELETMYQAIKVAQLPGLDALRGWSMLPMLPTSRAIANVIQYLSLEDTRKGALAVDVGGTATTIAAARAGQVQLHVRSDLGTAFNARGVLQARGEDAIARWLPFEPRPGEIQTVVMEKELYPASVPQDTNELFIEQAIAREAVRLALAQARLAWPPELAGPYAGSGTTPLMPYLEPIIGGGSAIGYAPRAGQAALMLLDALEPIGVTTLVLDAGGLLPALGACALAHPLAAVQALGSSGLTTLGTVVAPVTTSRPRLGESILNVRMKYKNGGDLEVQVAAGSLEVLPLPLGQKAVLELRPRGGVDIGRGRGRGGSIEVQGGQIGLIIDARGRPLVLPADAVKRRERIQQWLWDMGA
jgi:uncharacterized protein (TIGR01319 family)